MAFPSLQQYTSQQVGSYDIAYQTPLVSTEQMQCINQLVGDAAFDNDVFYQLVVTRNDDLCETYQLSATTWGYLKEIEADSLEEFCSQVLKLQDTWINH